MFFDNSQKFLLFFGRVRGSVLERFNEALDGGEGGFDLMGNIGDEITPDIFKASDLCHIVHNHKRSDSVIPGIIERDALSMHHLLSELVYHHVPFFRIAVT